MPMPLMLHTQTRTIMQMPTLPKMLMPNLPNLRRALYSALTARGSGGQAAVLSSGASAGSSAATASPTLAPPTTRPDSPAQRSTFPPTMPQQGGVPFGPDALVSDRSRFSDSTLQEGPITGVPFPPLQVRAQGGAGEGWACKFGMRWTVHFPSERLTLTLTLTPKIGS